MHWEAPTHAPDLVRFCLLEGRHLVTQNRVSLVDMEIVPPTLCVQDFESDVDVRLWSGVTVGWRERRVRGGEGEGR